MDDLKVEALRTSTLHRNLDAKIKIVGMEVHDLILVLIFAATMNLFFGRSGWGFVFVIIVPGILGLVLYVIKRNKPEGFIKDYVRYHLSPGWFAAGLECTQNQSKGVE